MDFGAFPPEHYSTRIHAGGGSAPLMHAGVAWHNLARGLSTAAVCVESVITRLATEHWMGPASMAMVNATRPFLAWLTYTAECTDHAGSKAMESAAAFEVVFGAIVRPEEVAANRQRLATLVAANILGHHTPEIAALEADYGRMWVQNALAMHRYATSSGTAGILEPLTTPSQIASFAGVAAQAAAVGHAAASASAQAGLGKLITAIPHAVTELAAPLSSAASRAGIDDIFDIAALLDVTFVQNAINGSVNTAAWFVCNGIDNAVFLGHTFSASAPAAPDAASAAAGMAATSPAVTPAGGGAVLAGMGEASSVGKLSVPVSWSSAAATVPSGATALEGSGWSVPEETGPITAMPGAPATAAAGKGSAASRGPRYGFTPTVMPKQVFV